MEYYSNYHLKSKGGRIIRFIGLILGGVVLAGLFALVFGYVVMLLWNWIMPALFGISTITFWQAFGIILLGKLIFGGLGHHPRREEDSDKHRHFKNWVHDGIPPWRSKTGNGFRKWKYYDEYWKNEGQAAFDAYVENKRQGEADRES